MDNRKQSSKLKIQRKKMNGNDLKKSSRRYKDFLETPNKIFKQTAQHKFNLDFSRQKISVEKYINDNLNSKTSQNHTDRVKHKRNETQTNSKQSNETSDYYKYWKKKANQYQQQNFKLQRKISDLLMQLQILKHKNNKMEKTIQNITKNNHPQQYPQKNYPLIYRQNLHKIQKNYIQKIQEFKQAIKNKQILIQRQNYKIQELTKLIPEKSITYLTNFDDRLQETRLKESYGLKMFEKDFATYSPKSLNLAFRSVPQRKDINNSQNSSLRSSKYEYNSKISN